MSSRAASLVERSKARVRAYARHAPSRSEYARAAGVPKTTLIRMDETDWNPTAETLDKLEAAIPPDWAPPPAVSAAEAEAA
jgi:hypothetical protein